MTKYRKKKAGHSVGKSTKCVNNCGRERMRDRSECSKCCHLRRRYDLLWHEVEEMMIAQDHCCAICRTPIEFSQGNKLGKHSAVIDHNHSTKETREILCVSCNLGIGYAQEDVFTLERMIHYVKKHNMS